MASRPQYTGLAPAATDDDTYLIDCRYESTDDPAWLGEHLKHLAGVVDRGLFVDVAGRIVAGEPSGRVRLNP